MRKQSAVDRGRNKPRSVSVSASWRSVATLFSRPTKPLRFTPLASNHRSTDTGSMGPDSIANTITSTTDSRGAPWSALRLWKPIITGFCVFRCKYLWARKSPKGRAYYRLWRKRVVNDPALLPNMWANLKARGVAWRANSKPRGRKIGRDTLVCAILRPETLPSVSQSHADQRTRVDRVLWSTRSSRRRSSSRSIHRGSRRSPC